MTPQRSVVTIIGSRELYRLLDKIRLLHSETNGGEGPEISDNAVIEMALAKEVKRLEIAAKKRKAVAS